jgi:hypothetical protein
MDSLKKYNFKDDHGHPLENCQDYIDLIHRASSAESSLAAMRQRAERAESVAVTVCKVVDRLRLKFEIQRNVNFTGGAVASALRVFCEEIKDL